MVRRNITEWGETFNIEFDLILNEWVAKKDTCYNFVSFEQPDVHPGVWYCPLQTEGGIAFEAVKKEKVVSQGQDDTWLKKYYPVIKELHKLYHIQLRQIQMDTKFRRIMKIDETIVEENEIDDQHISGEIELTVHDISNYIGGRFYNLKVTE